MEAAACGSALQFSTWIGSEKKGRRRNSFVGFNHRCRKEYSFEVINLDELQLKSVSNGRRRIHMGIPHSCKGSKAPTLESGNCCTSFDGRWFLKKKAEEVASCLDGRCIFLVGMMGSGKTTVGKVLSEALDYAFVDSDSFVEQAVGGTSVAQIFNQCGESFFRDYESEALRKLSLMPQQVVATGGGAVVRPVNWKYMKQGISVFIDVPLDALARRIAAVGTDSRPLLHFESGDPYTKAFVGLFTLSKKRVEAYARADVTVSLQHMAAKAGIEDLSDITATAIAIETLVQIENFLRGNNGISIRMFP